MSTSGGSTQALARLKTAFAAAVAIAFFRRFIKPHLSPALSEMISPALPSLSRRWSAKRLQVQLQAAAAVNEASPTSETPSRTLSETWSPASLTRFLTSFQRTTSASPSVSATAAPAVDTTTPTLAPAFSTYCEFIEDSLHHPAWGYYCDGRVAFGEESDVSDFTTFPVSMRPTFGAMLADRLHELWLAAQQPTSAPPSHECCFVIVELGAGTGVLAHDVLAHIASTAPELYAVVRYVIGERSHALRALQEATNARFVAEGRLSVVPADARDLKGSMMRETLLEIARGAGGGRSEMPLRGAVISNELPDAFGVERVLVSEWPARRASFSEPPVVAPPSSESSTATPVAATSSPSNQPQPILRRSTDGADGGGSRSCGQGDDDTASFHNNTSTRALRMQRGVVIPLIRAADLSRCAGHLSFRPQDRC